MLSNEDERLTEALLLAEAAAAALAADAEERLRLKTHARLRQGHDKQVNVPPSSLCRFFYLYLKRIQIRYWAIRFVRSFLDVKSVNVSDAAAARKAHMNHMVWQDLEERYIVSPWHRLFRDL